MTVQIRKPSMAHLLQVLDLLLVIFSGGQIYSCSATQSMLKKMINTHLTNSNVKTQRASVIACCHECNIYSWCQSLSYKESSKKCHLSSVGCTVVGSNGENDNEWVTFVKHCTATVGYLVKGLSNSRFTASSQYGAHRPWHARLSGQMGWAARYSNSNQYVQADLAQVRVIVAFALQGRPVAGGYSGHVTRFRVLTSVDCVTFSYIVDDSDDKKIFDGNTGLRQTVTRYLQRGWVLARCVRINPVEWFTYIPILRFDALGF